MSKKLICLLLAAVMILSFTACGSNVKQDSKAETDTYYKYDLDGFFKLGDYKGITVTAYDTTATDEEVEELIQSYLDSDSFFKDVDRAAALTDRVTIDYEGKLDGEAFDGGSAEGAQIILGKSGFIDGFDDAIIGMKAGETKDANLTFPDDYNNPNLKGKETVFTITVHAVQEAVPSELSDEFLAEYSDLFDSVEALREYCVSYIEKNKSNQEASKNLQAAYEAVMANSEYIGDLPAADLARNLEQTTTYFQNLHMQYLMYGYFSGEAKEFLEYITGEEIESPEAFYQETAEDQTKKDLITVSVASKEKFTVSDDEYKELTSKYADYGSESEEAFVEDNGGEEYLRFYLLQTKVSDFLVSNAKFVDADGNAVEYPAPTEAPAE